MDVQLRKRKACLGIRVIHRDFYERGDICSLNHDVAIVREGILPRI